MSQVNPLKKRMKDLGISVNRNKWIQENIVSDDEVYIKGSKYCHIRRRVFKDNYMEYKCSICGVGGNWNNKPLTLQIDHIDGDYNNNTKDNLRWLCPNCHSQTSTYGNKDGHKSKRPRRTNEQATCPVCHKVFIKKDREQVCCSRKCACINRTNPVPISKEELLCALKSAKNFEAVGRMYGRTGKGIRKWCKKYNISTHTKDYK